jgi:hypothetical protein
MDRTVRKYTNFDEMKADEYRYWQSRPVHERMDAVEEMIKTAYALKGWEMEPDVPRLQRPFVRLPCPWRAKMMGRPMHLNTLQEIERAIDALTPHQINELYEWLDQRHPQPIDAQLKADLDAGRIDDRINRALADHKAGNTQSL